MVIAPEPVEHIVYLNDHEMARAVLSPKAARDAFLATVEVFRLKSERSTLALYVLRRDDYYEMIERRTVGAGR